MSAARRRATVALGLGVTLVLIGGVLLIARYLIARYEHHSFTHGQPPHRYISVTKGARYWLAVPDGVRHEQALGQPPTALQCGAQVFDGAELTLDVTPESTDTKMINIVGSFTAPVSARVHVTCAGLGSVYLDNTSSDPSGIPLVLACVTLVVGLPLLLSGLRGLASARIRDVGDAAHPPEVRSSPGV